MSKKRKIKDNSDNLNVSSKKLKTENNSISNILLLKECEKQAFEIISTASKTKSNIIIKFLDKIIHDNKDYNINAQREDGKTLLHIAFEERYFAVAAFLLSQNDIDPNITDINNQTSANIFYRLIKPRSNDPKIIPAIMEGLEDLGCMNPNPSNKKPRIKNEEQFHQMLDKIDPSQSTAVHRNLLNFIKNVPQINFGKLDDKGQTIIHKILSKNFIKTLAALLKSELKLDINVLNTNNQTPLDFVNERIESSTHKVLSTLNKMKEMLIKSGGETRENLSMNKVQEISQNNIIIEDEIIFEDEVGFEDEVICSGIISTV